MWALMHQPVKHCGGQCLVIGEAARLLDERQVAREHRAAALVALANTLKNRCASSRPKGKWPISSTIIPLATGSS